MGATRPGQSYLAPSTALPPTGPGRGCKGRDERGALKYLPEDGDRGGVRPQQPGRWPHLEQLVLQLQCPLSELHQRLLLAGGCCLQLSFQPLLQALVPARRSLSTQPSPNLYLPLSAPRAVPHLWCWNSCSRRNSWRSRAARSSSFCRRSSRAPSSRPRTTAFSSS